MFLFMHRCSRVEKMPHQSRIWQGQGTGLPTASEPTGHTVCPFESLLLLFVFFVFFCSLLFMYLPHLFIIAYCAVDFILYKHCKTGDQSLSV